MTTINKELRLSLSPKDREANALCGRNGWIARGHDIKLLPIIFNLYTYFVPTEKEEYLRNGKMDWPCKIRTTVPSVENRVNQQKRDKTAIIDVVFEVNACRQLESFLHEALRLCGRYHQTDKGKEWFLTTPDQVILWWELWKSTREQASQSVLAT